MTDEPTVKATRDAEIEILRALTPEQKVATMQGLIQTAFDLKAALAGELGLTEEWRVARAYDPV